MNDLDDTSLRVEIDEIKRNIDNIIKNIDEFHPARREESTNNESEMSKVS
jgi:hypothetical protein